MRQRGHAAGAAPSTAKGQGNDDDGITRIEADGIRGTGDRRNRCSGHRNRNHRNRRGRSGGRGHKRGSNAIEDLEAAESHGFSTRFPLNSAFIFTFGALGGMLFGFDTGIISGASPLIDQTSA